jgi:phospholipase/lecithinase/hemolysin
VTTVVDGIALNLVRLHGLGFRNIVVANLASMACSPYITVASNYTSCSSNSTLAYESSTHNALLARRVRLLKQELRGASFVIVDQTKAFEHIFHHGAQYGKRNSINSSATQGELCHRLTVNNVCLARV